MMGANLVGGVIEVDEVATADVYGADAEASCSGVYQAEIHQAFECGLKGSNIVVAHSHRAHGRIKERRRLTGFEETGRAEEERVERAQLIDDAVGELVFEL